MGSPGSNVPSGGNFRRSSVCADAQTDLNLRSTHMPTCTLRWLLLDFSLSVKAATLIFISGCGSAISSAKEGISGFIYNFVKSR